ncbi:MAG: class I SAM-dependent methyltransferase [Anaerolineales bacterium]|nr:MAG: class I SAM-dependent methyltransferase [Anaerolineales bacterium]
MITPARSPGSSAIRDGYNRWSLVYDHDANPLPALEEPFLREQLGTVRGAAVLDLGCGTGRHSLWLASEGAVVTAVDFSEGMLAQACRKPGADAVRFVVHDLEDSLPFADGFFDRVVSGLVLEHIQDLDHFFFEVRRVLCPGGRAVLSAMHPAMFLRGAQARFTDPDSGQIVQPGSYPHQISDFVMAALRNNLSLLGLSEHSANAEFASHYPRSEKYIGWPMLVVLGLAR